MKGMLLFVSVSLLLASCVIPPAGPLPRIQANHAKFSALSLEHQQLVRQGKIAPGMGKDGVYLAWGNPAQVYSGMKEGESAERWDYVGSRAVFLNSLNHGVYGLQCPSYGRRHCHYDSYLGPDIAYVPYRAASVWFLDGKVEAWEQANP